MTDPDRAVASISSAAVTVRLEGTGTPAELAVEALALYRAVNEPGLMPDRTAPGVGFVHVERE